MINFLWRVVRYVVWLAGWLVGCLVKWPRVIRYAPNMILIVRSRRTELVYPSSIARLKLKPLHKPGNQRRTAEVCGLNSQFHVMHIWR